MSPEGAAPAGQHARSRRVENGPVGVLVMSYGSPAAPSEIPAYLTDVRGGRPPSDEQLAELAGRYEAIGGVSPLRRRTLDQLRALAAALEVAEPGRFVVAGGTRHARPSIEDAVAELAAAGAADVVGIVLAPHFSSLSVGAYAERAARAALSAQRALRLRTVEHWHLHPGLVDLLAQRVAHAQGRAAAAAGAGSAGAAEGMPEDVPVVFTAHSLPRRIVDVGDPYPDQLRESAQAVAERAGVRRWQLAWQSAGRTGEAWLGPDVTDVVRALGHAGAPACVVCPQGFVSDHLEVLYDIDIAARRAAAAAGVHLERTASLNDDPRFVSVLVGVVREETARVCAAR